LLQTRTEDSCGPSGCLIDVLANDSLDIDDDPEVLYELSLSSGWGDGLPLIPPTERRVRRLLASTPFHTDDVISLLPPANRTATVELAAINAAMAGCEPAAFPFVIAAIEAIAEPQFNAFGIATTTSGVHPMLIVNGPSRDRLGIDYQGGCMGGAAGRGSMTIGRAVSLAVRNIGGQLVGVNSKSVFGQPARTGLCFGEWEERSPWPTLAQQRGFDADADVVTVHGGKGTFPLADINTAEARELLYLLAKSMAFPLGNMFLAQTASVGQMVLAINPIWAEWIGRVLPHIEDVQEVLWENCWQPIDLWPESNRTILESRGRVDQRGRVYLCQRPDQLVVIVCGGLGNLHAVCLPSWAASEMVSSTAIYASDWSS
jgi:hypothetical protein